MKTLNIFLVLLVSYSFALAQQQIQTTNEWYLANVYSSWTDTVQTRFSRNSGGKATFGFYGETGFFARQWGIQMDFSRIFDYLLLTTDSVYIDCELVKGINNMIAVCIFLGVQDSIGYWCFLGNDNRISLNSTFKKFCWDMSVVKKAGIKTIHRIYLSFQIVTSDSVYTGADVEVSNLSGMYGINTHITDFDTTATGIPESAHQIPFEFVLEQNYPNPFNPSTTIKLSIPEKEQVNLVVFNSLGQEVKTLVNEERRQGSYEVNFNAFNLPSGIYFYRLQTGNLIETKKMLFVK
jgi:hypothetical protein